MSTKVMLTATKPQKYGTRRLQAGDVFEARSKDVKLLVALRRAVEGRQEVDIPAIPKSLVERVKPPVIETLYGSSVLESTYQIGDETVQLGTIVANAHKDSGLSVEAWNMLGTGERDEKLFAELKRLQDAAAPAPEDDDEGESEEEEIPPDTDNTTQKTPEELAAEELTAARAKYKEVVGRAAYGGWDVAKINENIEIFEKDKAKK